VFAKESWFFLCRVLSFIFYWFGMVRRKLTIPERWQAVGMHNGGFSHRHHVRMVHPKWSCDQSNRAWRWCNVNCGRFMGRRARIPLWWRGLITVRVLMHARFDWSHDHLGWTIRTWRRVHWSDESRFLLRPTDGRARVWRQWNTTLHGIVWTASYCKKCCPIRALCGLALSSMNIGLSANAWLSKWGTTSMMRRVTELHNKHSGYTRYWFLCLTHMHNRCI
jgi:hypothetical protein